jgi:intracellular sulfur oxidation DsrE/DsrF family protein
LVFSKNLSQKGGFAMDRRGFFKLLGIAGSIPLLGKFAHSAPPKLGFKDLKKESQINVVYHADFGDPQRFTTMLRNIRNHLSVYDNDPTKIKIVIVAHGQGVKFFMKDLTGSPWEKENFDPKIGEEVRDLNAYGVDPLICEITLTRLKLDPNKLYDFCKIVPSGVGAIGELQTKGYAYIKVQ